MERKRLINKIINLFFENDARTEEIRIKEDLASNRLAAKVSGIVFFINSTIIVYLFFNGNGIDGKLGIINFILTICVGISALYFDEKVKKITKIRVTTSK
jgi:hypothetical protein